MRIRRLYGSINDIPAGNRTNERSKNPTKTKKRRFRQSSLFRQASQVSIEWFSGNSAISAISGRRGPHIGRLGWKQPKSHCFLDLSVSRKPGNAVIREIRRQTSPLSHENAFPSKILAWEISEAQRHLSAHFAVSTCRTKEPRRTTKSKRNHLSGLTVGEL